MNRVTVFLASALALLLASSAFAQMSQSSSITGTIGHYDPAARTILFNDGSRVKLDDTSVVLVDNRPVVVESLRPGQYVVVQSAQPVTTPPPAVVVSPPASSSSSTVVATAPSTVVVPPPAPASSAAVVMRPADTGTVVVPDNGFSGTVARVDPDGTIWLNDGRAIRVSPNTTVVMSGGKTVDVSTLKPGKVVMVEPATNYPNAMIGRGTVIDATRILIQESPQEP